MIPRPDATTVISPATLHVNAAAVDGLGHPTADATTLGIVHQETAARTIAATEDPQIAVAMCAESVTTGATTEGPKEGPVAVTRAHAATAVTTAHAGTDVTTELNVAEAPSRKEAVTKKRDLAPPTAGAMTAIQVINKNKSRPPPNRSDALLISVP